MERILRDEIDDVELLPHFNRVHLGAHSSVEECWSVYRHFWTQLAIVDDYGWTQFPRQGAHQGNRHVEERLYGDWLVGVARMIKALGRYGDRTLVHRGKLKPRDSTDHDHVRCAVSLLDDEIVPNMNEYKFGNMHVVGELKSASVAATHSPQLAEYVRHIFRTQETRHFVIAFILAGPLMRVYKFDRLGLTSSDMFDVNLNPIRLIRTLIAFFRMNETQLGHDPTILWNGPAVAGQPSLQRRRMLTLSTGARLEIERCLFQGNSVSRHGTMCWLVSEMSGGERQMPGGERHWYVVEDSWQFNHREHEGILFQKASERGCKNIAKYRFHEPVLVNDAQQHLRFQDQEPYQELQRTVFDYTADSTPLEKAGSAIKLLQALRAALEGHRSLYENGILHRDISVGNIMASPDAPHGFLTGLDLAIDISRPLSGNPVPVLRTLISSTQSLSTRSPPHMAGNQLFTGVSRLEQVETTLSDILQLERKLRASLDLQEQADLREQIRRKRATYDQVNDDSYANDLESFFWVLLWVACNYNVHGDWIGQTELNNWALKSTKCNLRVEKFDLLTSRPMLSKILAAAGQLEGIYKDVHQCVLSLQPLFSDRALFSRMSWNQRAAPDYKALGLDNESLYLRMRAIIDRSLDHLIWK